MKQRNKHRDISFESLLEDKLRSDPVSCLNTIKEQIDTIKMEINDNTLFDLLKPTITHKDFFDPNSPKIISPEGVDMLFLPAVRDKLKKWQQIYFDEDSSANEKEEALGKIKKVFTSLTYKGQGRPQVLSKTDRERLKADCLVVDRTCRKIFQEAKQIGLRNLKIEEEFQDVGVEVVKECIGVATPEKLRNIILSKRYGMSIRSVEEFITNESNLDLFAQLRKPKVYEVTIEGRGKSKKITTKKSR